MPTPSRNHYEHRSGQSRAGAALVAAACSAHTHVHGGHDRIVPYDPDCRFGTVSPPSFRRGVYYPSLTGRGLRAPGIFSSFSSSGQRSFVAVSALGAGAGVLPARSRCTFLSRGRPIGLRDKTFKPIRRRSDYSAKNLSAVPEAFHVSALSSVCSLAGSNIASKRGRINDFVGQKGAA